MAALRYNLVQTTLGAPLLIGDTAIFLDTPLQEGGVNIPTLSGGDYIWLKINDELMQLTAYTAGATTGTVLREQGDTLEQDHNENDAVRHVATKEDFASGGSGAGVGDVVYLEKTLTPGTGNVYVNWAAADVADQIGTSIDLDGSNNPYIVVDGIYSIVFRAVWGFFTSPGTWREISIIETEGDYGKATVRTPQVSGDLTYQTVTWVGPLTGTIANLIGLEYNSDATPDDVCTFYAALTRLA